MMTFDDLYQTYFADVFRFAMWMTRNRGQAEDIVSETFIRAWAKRDRFRTETLKAYLFAIARNVHRNQLQRNQLHGDLTRTLVEGHLESDPELASIATRWKERLPAPPPPPINPEAQTAAFSEAKRQIANRIITVAAIAVVGTLTIAGTALIGALLMFSG